MLSLDLGSSGLKTAIISDKGDVAAYCYEPYIEWIEEKLLKLLSPGWWTRHHHIFNKHSHIIFIFIIACNLEQPLW